MLQTRVIPCLLLNGEVLVKSVKFKDLDYIGDPINAVRIYNELEVDELIFLNIKASREGSGINYQILQDIADESFMPMSYGGGVSNLNEMQRIFEIGFEKISLNTHAIGNPALITEAAKEFGSQSIVVSIDVKKSFFGQYQVVTKGAKVKTSLKPIDWAKQVEDLGAGEILLTSVLQDGTWQGYDLDLVEMIADSVSIPVVANGGAGQLQHFKQAVNMNASAVAAGSLFVYQKAGMGVLVNYPTRQKLEDVLNTQ